ncbi:MAG TPA: PEP-CTERM sorting domain-containing protein [Myxococcota bacterium]|nr:PEP-CTERM sorting domain-containing protein [Myxococcota bacterium]
MRAVGSAGLLTRLAALAALGLGLFTGGSASAAPIGPDCGTCQGSIYTLQYNPTPVATTATTQTFRITFTIDTSGYDGGGTGIDTVAVKISDSLVSGSLVAAPLGVDNWYNFVNQGLNAGGCSSGGSGYDCTRIKVLLGAEPAPVGGTLTWQWDLEIATGDLFTGPFEASVKARYVDDDGAKVGALVSEGITLQPNGNVVPEPASAALTGLGLVAVGMRRRRARRR